MNRKQTINIPAALVPQFEAWGKLTARLFGEIREQTGLEAVSIVDSEPIPVLKRPKQVPKDQEWFWSEEWLKGEGEANEDIAAGRVKRFENVNDLIKDLQSHI